MSKDFSVLRQAIQLKAGRADGYAKDALVIPLAEVLAARHEYTGLLTLRAGDVAKDLPVIDFSTFNILVDDWQQGRLSIQEGQVVQTYPTATVVTQP